MATFSIDDKVRIKSKTVGEPLTASNVYRDTGGVGYIIKINEYGYPYTVGRNRGDSTGDYFNERDLELITKGAAQVARRTFKLIKDIPGVRKGAIYQEKCDDGTQDYELLDADTFMPHPWDTGRRSSQFPRAAVEEAKNYFVEVFQVEPQYMTREELDQWEAFKTRKSAERVVKRKYTRHTPVAKPRKNNWTPAKRKAHSEKLKAYWATKRAA